MMCCCEIAEAAVTWPIPSPHQTIRHPGFRLRRGRSMPWPKARLMDAMRGG
jgi:hypothetical protein